MILPDLVSPRYSLYYCGAIILSEMRDDKEIDVLDLYIRTNSKVPMEYSLFVFSMDWLFLLGRVRFNKEKNIELCI